MDEQLKEKYITIVNNIFTGIPYAEIADTKCIFNYTQLLANPKPFIDDIQLLVSDDQFLELNTFDIYEVLMNLIKMYYNVSSSTQGVVLSLMCETLITSYYFLMRTPNDWNTLPEDITSQIQNAIITK